MKMLFKLLILILIFFTTACDKDSTEISNLLDSYINALKSTNDYKIIFKEHCTSNFIQLTSKMEMSEKYQFGGFPFAPFAYLKKYENFNFNNRKALKINFKSKNDAIIILETDSHAIEAPIKFENKRWLFSVGEVKVYRLQSGNRVLLSPNTYIDWYIEMKAKWDEIKLPDSVESL